jgi:pimeloyl-ACP methyl ester carboxylesterase
MKPLKKTPPFRDPNGEVLPDSIAEIKYRLLGGLDQWVMIRGESLTNPPLILLHGGPGFSETHFFRYYNAPLEQAFTVVYWDQRGSGQSFDPKIPQSSMTVAQLITDLDELVEAVCQRLGKQKVVLFGHSWGSVLGVLYAARFPEKVAAYVGSGQLGDWPASEVATYAYVLAAARRLNHRQALKELQAIGPPPHTAKALWTQRLWLHRLEGGPLLKSVWDLGRMLISVPETSIFDLFKVINTFQWCLDIMWAEVSAINLIKVVPALQMPVFLFLGRHDHCVPSEISVTYFKALTAPSKMLVWFEKSGHEPFVDEPTKFNASMVALVRPIVG